jgi:hypothetical protein
MILGAERALGSSKSDNLTTRLQKKLTIAGELERAFNFAQTGSARAIASRLMDRLWIGKALVQDGMPCFSSAVTLGHNSDFNTMGIRLEAWPDTKHGGVALASSKSHIYHYRQGHFEVGCLLFCSRLQRMQDAYAWMNDAPCRVCTRPQASQDRSRPILGAPGVAGLPVDNLWRVYFQSAMRDALAPQIVRDRSWEL